jgi:hypothetical protein
VVSGAELKLMAFRIYARFCAIRAKLRAMG